MREAVLLSAVRTPIGAFQGSLSTFRAPELGGFVVKEAIRRAGLSPEQIEEVILGCVLTAGLGQNPARQAAIHAGVPHSVGAFTVNKVCGSGLKAVMLAAQAIRAGDADLIVAGGMESMSNAPFLLPQARQGMRLGHSQVLDAMVHDGLWDIYNDFHMGMCAEKVAEKYGISQKDQDAFAYQSHQKALKAQDTGKFQAEILPVSIPQRKGEALSFSKDEGPRREVDLDKMAKLRPAFKKEGGSVTPANASTINDGACALVVASLEKAEELSCTPLARISGYATGGMAPEWVMMAPVEAVKNLSAKTKMPAPAYDLIELNEAFSVASVALLQELHLPAEKVNVHGGAVALGHPIGASGARILTTLLYALQDRQLKTGLASLCLGGGNAVAISIERI
jgi:acetyl-CoA C-acetyltransferase